MTRLAAMLALLLSAGPVMSQDLSSQRDYLDPGQRDRPIACKPGDIERHRGMTLGELFGSEWPLQQAPSDPAVSTRPHFTRRGRMQWPPGLALQDSLVVAAVLVGADGKPMRAEILCETRMGMDAAMTRMLLDSKFAPAKIDGRPVTSVLVSVQRFSATPRDDAHRRPRR
jgi:hypothetical protein